ncbi:MAG: hypothetical protein KatS3mg107_1303 [Gemmataceae bacterium]|jgi:hypothetical protein|nr:MAG: hypothetical protein KatS3mg107_1303 [Gemmataceae bacterium]
MMEAHYDGFRQGLAAELLLVRMLLPVRQPPSPKQVRDSLSTLLGWTINENALKPIQEQLVASGDLFRTPRKAHRLTEAGRRRALNFLGLQALPPRCTWPRLLSKYLFAALIRHWEQDRARQKNLLAPATATVFSAIPHAPPSGPHSDAKTTSIDLRQFGQAVLRHAASLPQERRFGPNKAYISCVWEATQADPTFPRMDLDTFKQYLVQANCQGILQLSRADLVNVMNTEWLSQSETHYLNAQFHFVLLPDLLTARR